MSHRKSLATFLALSLPVVLFSANATPSRAQSQTEKPAAVAPAFEVTSIKPDKSGDPNFHIKIEDKRLTATNVTLQLLIRKVYGVENNQISGAPNWLSSERYDIEAEVASSAADELRKASLSLSLDQFHQENERMLQALLSNRFKLALHREIRMIPVYELVISEDDPKLRESDPASADSNLRVIQVESGRITGREVPIATLARILSEQLGRPVLDKTGLSNHYDITLQWEANSELPGPAMSAALQEQLGLKLESQQISKEFLVIDHVEIPSAE
jgi:uncharacterized protein (TIGR03435 family)